MTKLNRQHSPVKQPENSTRFLLNCVTKNDSISSISSEPGNMLLSSLNGNIVGTIPIGRNEVIIFVDDNTINRLTYDTGVIEILQQDSRFNFSINYPITGSYREVRSCESIIYWSDHNNPDRFYNVSRPEKFKDEFGNFDITKTLFNAQVTHPTITTSILNSGGQLPYGTYNFAIECLTSNEDSIFISPIDINYTPIIYQPIEGALNIATNLPDIGGKPLSNKSIKLNITNIPDDTTLIRIIVFRHITSDGLTSDAHVVGELIPYTGSTLEYIYKRFNVDNGDYLVDKNQYLVPKAIYETSLDNLIVESRLLKYNLKEANRNYGEYQKYASKINAKYVVDVVDKSDPNVYLLNRTLLGGEIILPCINWVHRDGTVSNSYPLVNRPKNTNDEILVDDILNVGQQVEKWNYFDTSIKDATSISGYVSSGEFGYYESTQLYSNPPNFCESDYWGLDYEGNNILDTPVRLFVVPDRSVEPHDVDNTIRPIGIWFDETTIEFPNTDVVGYYFSITIVNQSNIEAKGIGFSASTFADGETDPVQRLSSLYNPLSSGSSLDTFYNYITDEVYLKNNFVTGELIGMEGVWQWRYSALLEDTNFNGIFEDDLPYDDLKFTLISTVGETFIPKPYEVQKLKSSLVINSRSTVENYKNVSMSNFFNIIEPEINFLWEANNQGIKYLCIKNTSNPIPNIWNIASRRITNLSENISFNGNYFLSPANIDNVATVSVLDTRIFGDSEIVSLIETVADFYIESKSNWFLRHTGSNQCNKHIQKEENYTEFFFNKIVEPYKDKFKVKDSICPFFPGYNKDYSYVQDLNRYRNLGFTFDYCSACLSVYPNRIIFSPQSFEEELSDNYRINRANDYIDIPAHTGGINKIDYKDGKLWIRTDRATWIIQPNPQQMELSETTVQIGTGDFLSIPARELNVTPTGYGGQQHKLNSINCERGLIWVDNNRKEIYWSHGEFTEIHRDLEQWFYDNVTSNQFRFGYDPLHDRVLMTHKDLWTLSYCFKVGGWKSWHSYIPEWYLYDANTMYSIYNNSVWKHGNANNYSQFYGLNFPSVVEFILTNEGKTFIPQSIQYNANVEVNENGYFQDVLNVTYDQMLCYNERQSTGIQNLVLDQMNNIYYDGQTTHVKRINRDWKISPIKDLAVGAEIWTTDISSIKIGTQGWFDLLPQVDYNKRQVEIGQFLSKWIAVRLYFNDTTKQVSLEYIDTLKLNNYR